MSTPQKFVDEVRKVVLKAICYEHSKRGSTCQSHAHCNDCEQFAVNITQDIVLALSTSHDEGVSGQLDLIAFLADSVMKMQRVRHEVLACKSEDAMREKMSMSFPVLQGLDAQKMLEDIASIKYDSKKAYEIALALLSARNEALEEAALIAVDSCWIATDMKYPKGKYQHEVASKIATAIRNLKRG